MDRRDFLRVSTALGAAAMGRRVHRSSFSSLAQADLPLPSAAQLRWQREELAMFVHFTVNTFTGKEWGDGTESPRIFNPARLDARQWARVARDAGFRTMILTAKHHDGFCLWPSALTTHTVARSPWRDGRGDVVREFVDACRAESLGVGLYLSPWDRHEASYGDSPRYMDFYCGQLEELLTHYGPVVEVWFDGANGEGPNGKKQVYDWGRIHRTVRNFQPNAVMFSDAGPDVRWIGNENGTAGDPDWATVDPAAVPYPGASGPGIEAALQHGDPHGAVWRPGESDVSIRPGWFWRASENDKVRSADNLLELYAASVGRNSKLLLNVPPTDEGLLHATDVARLKEFRARWSAIFERDFALGVGASASASAPARVAPPPPVSVSTRETGAPRDAVDDDPDTFWAAVDGATEPWIELDLGRSVTFDTISLQEAIALGQRVSSYRVEAMDGDRATPVSHGTTIGYRKIDRFAPVTAQRVRLTIESALAAPMIARISLHRWAEAR